MAKKKKITKGFTLKIENSRILKTIVETLAAIIDETEFRVTPSEFVVSAMDPSRICLLKLEIKKQNFDDYDCNEEFKIGLNLDDFDKILKRASSDDAIELVFTEEEQKIKIKMKRGESERTRTFSLALLDIEYEEIPMDNLLKIEYDSSWKMDPDFLTEAVKDAEIYSEILNVKAKKDQGLTFSSSGQIGEMVYDITLEDLIEPDIENESLGAYSLTFLKSILKLGPITEQLEISLKSDHPIKMIFNIMEGGVLNYFLAPRVEEPDEEYDDDDMDYNSPEDEADETQIEEIEETEIEDQQEE